MTRSAGVSVTARREPIAAAHLIAPLLMTTVTFFTEDDENYLFSVSTDAIPQVGDIVIYRLRCDQSAWDPRYYDPEVYQEHKRMSGLHWIATKVIREFMQNSLVQIDQVVSVYVRPESSAIARQPIPLHQQP